MSSSEHYNAEAIEKKWQKKWEDQFTYSTADNVEAKENFYALSEFSYPSGNLHVGHWYAFAMPDIYARFKRMSGYNVLYPTGFDAFGLPAENAAIKRGVDPKLWTWEHMGHMRTQLKTMGASFDWSREVVTADPQYYKWTQWMFNQFYKNNLVYRDLTKVNWCDNDKTILANEQVVNGHCQRCDGEVVQRDMPQWMLKITDFADDLVDDLDDLDWDHSIKQAQREWIGRKEGSLIPFKLSSGGDSSEPEIDQESKVFGEVKAGSSKRDIVKIILENSKGEIFVLKHRSGNFDVPVGDIEEGQSLLEAGLQELREETPYTNFSFKRKLKSYDINYTRQGVNHHGTVSGLVFKLDNEEISTRSKEDININAQEMWMCPYDTITSFVGDSRSYAVKQLISDYIKTIEVFTTRADTLFGVTYVVLAPEHNMVHHLKNHIENWDEVQKYLNEVAKKSDLDRQQSTEKTGVELKGIKAINPANKEEVSVWIADYVLAHFGTGAVMAVPSHDERDCEFALKYDLPFKFVVLPSAGEPGQSRELQLFGETQNIFTPEEAGEKNQESINTSWNKMYDILAETGEDYLKKGNRFCCPFEGKLINSGAFSVQSSQEARKNITSKVEGLTTKTYRLRDWGVSRQRYWGCPIPIVYDPEGNPHSVPDEHLPWILPTDLDHTPDGTAPLARSEEFKKRTEKIFGKGWTPEVDTMDTFVDSAWYFYRYLDSQNGSEFATKEKLAKWMPVDMYFGGAEHTTMHLLYSRFWTKALFRLGLVNENEPYKKRINRGLILGPDGTKMSKSKGNVIDPDEVVSHVGADTVRMYLAFIGPFNEPGNYPWDPNGVVGIRRFLDRVWRLCESFLEDYQEDLQSNYDTNIKSYYLKFFNEKETHKLIKKVSQDIERLKFNTAISSMMKYLNDIRSEKVEHPVKGISSIESVQSAISAQEMKIIIQILAPFAPHIAEEMWDQLREVERKFLNKEDQDLYLIEGSVHYSSWPSYDKDLIIEDLISLPIQINGKVRAHIQVSPDSEQDLLKEMALSHETIKKWIDGKSLKKFIYVPGKIINIVI